MKKFEELDENIKEKIGYYLSETIFDGPGLGKAFELLGMWEESRMCNLIEESFSQLYDIFDDYLH